MFALDSRLGQPLPNAPPPPCYCLAPAHVHGCPLASDRRPTVGYGGAPDPGRTSGEQNLMLCKASVHVLTHWLIRGGGTEAVRTGKPRETGRLPQARTLCPRPAWHCAGESPCCGSIGDPGGSPCPQPAFDTHHGWSRHSISGAKTAKAAP